MLNAATKKIIGIIAAALIGIFVFALAESISSGFAGFYGGLPFWIIVLFVMGLVIYDLIEECFGMTRGISRFFQVFAIFACGAAFTYASWGASTLFESGTGVRIRSLGSSDAPYLVDGFWPQLFWYVAATGFAIGTVYLGLRKLNHKAAE